MHHLLRLNGRSAEGVQMPTDNVAAGPDAALSIDPATRAAIETANDLDLELYDAVRRDPEQYHAVGA